MSHEEEEHFVHFSKGLSESTKKRVLSYIISFPISYWKRNIFVSEASHPKSLLVLADGVKVHHLYAHEIMNE